MDSSQAAMAANFQTLLDRAAKVEWWGSVLHAHLFILAVLWLLFGSGLASVPRTSSRVTWGLGWAAWPLGCCYSSSISILWRSLIRALAGIVRVQVAYLASMHQINQTEALAQPVYLASASVGPEQMKDAVRQLQDSLRQTIEQVEDPLKGP